MLSQWQTESFSKTAITQSSQKVFRLSNYSSTDEQHIRSIAFDRGSNIAEHFRMASLKVGAQLVDATDIVIPPNSYLEVTVSYSPKNMDTSLANYNGWVTGEEERFIPKHPDEIAKAAATEKPVIHRAVLQAVYDYPKTEIYYIHLVGYAEKGPQGETTISAGSVNCYPGNGAACFDGDFLLDIPSLAPGGPKSLEISGPIKFQLEGNTIHLKMNDFPYVLMVLRSEEIPQLPSGVIATLVISGSEDVVASGSFDGNRVILDNMSFRIRVALGELSLSQVKQGMSALVDFDVDDISIETISPLDQGWIRMQLETSLPNNPSGNELFDQFLSNANIMGILEGDFTY